MAKVASDLGTTHSDCTPRESTTEPYMCLMTSDLSYVCFAARLLVIDDTAAVNF